MQIHSSRVTRWVSGLFILSLMMMGIEGCVKGTEPEEKEETFQGIQLTLETGQAAGTIGDASDDWQDIPGGCVKFSGAYPNPARVELNLHTTLCKRSMIEIYLESAPGKTAKTLMAKTLLEAGTHIYKAGVADLQPGIYRAWLVVHGDGTTQRTYGDIKIEH